MENNPPKTNTPELTRKKAMREHKQACDLLDEYLQSGQGSLASTVPEFVTWLSARIPS